MSKFFIIIFLFCFSSIFGQTNVRITGNVKSSENQNLAGAAIALEINQKQSQVITNSVGNFSEKIP